MEGSELMPMGEVLEVTRTTALTVAQQSQQMGIVLGKLKAHDEDIASLKDRMAARERREAITRAQCRQMRKAVIGRVNAVLKIRVEGGKVADPCIADEVRYRGGFISRLYTDAKNHSKMGESYTETLAVDYDEVMEYIGGWHPEVEGGTEGYKRYLDIRREERAKRDA